MPKSPEGRRAGRPWGPPKGSSKELNEVAEALRGWLDEAGIKVADLHALLTPDHFPDGIVPTQRKLYDLCAGKGLTWAFIDAVVDVCTPGNTRAQEKLRRMKELWEAAQQHPTPPEDQASVQAKLIAAYERIDRLRQAQADSETTRMRADHLVIVLLNMLGQLRARIGDLTRDRNRLLAERNPDPHAINAMESHLREARTYREDTEEAVRRAEQERDEALRVADKANRMARRLQDELDQLRAQYLGLAETPRADGEAGPRQTDATNGTHGTDSNGFPAPPNPDGAFLRDYSEALRKAQTVLDGGNETLEAAEEEIAQVTGSFPRQAGNVIPGIVLSRTTRDNPMSGADAEFEERYRAYVAKRYAQLTIYGVDLRPPRSRWPLDVSYLGLELAGPSLGAEDPQGLDALSSSVPGVAVERAEQALAGRQRTVVMGPAGSGKTTLLQWLAVNAARQTLPDRLGHLNGCVPFVLPLRVLARHGDSLPRPEELLAAAGCPLSGEQPQGWAGRVLAHGRALVLVDGVDEILPPQRARTRDWLEALLAQYPRGSYVVTTRGTSVPESWLEGVGFRHLMLRPMSERDVQRFISRWYEAARTGGDDEERQALTVLEASLQESMTRQQGLTDLATTPLLCTLICALNRDRRGYLPHGQRDLYDAALSMLLVRRDVERAISLPGGIQVRESESLHLLQALAYWMLRNGLSQADRPTALRALEPALATMPTVAAQGSVEQILLHLITRSGLLREPTADRVEFIHRTFQDYLSARAAVEAADLGMLVGNAHTSQWENVVRLATGHARPFERAQLLIGLMERGDQDSERRARLYRLAASCLEYAPELDPRVREDVERRAATFDPPTIG